VSLDTWLQIAVVCSLGAMSPGPSLLVVIKNTLSGGKKQGMACAIGHGIAFFLYAGLAVTGITLLVQSLPAAITALQITGGFFLLFIAIQMLHSSKKGYSIEAQAYPRTSAPSTEQQANTKKGFTEGFMIAFLNPKIMVFLIAVFSLFVTPEAGTIEKIGMAGMAGIIDGVWYLIVSIILAGTPLLRKMQERKHVVEGWIGIFLLIASILLLINATISAKII